MKNSVIPVGCVKPQVPSSSGTFAVELQVAMCLFSSLISSSFLWPRRSRTSAQCQSFVCSFPDCSHFSSTRKGLCGEVTLVFRAVCPSPESGRNEILLFVEQAELPNATWQFSEVCWVTGTQLSQSFTGCHEYHIP